MSFTIAVISDIHYSSGCTIAARRGDFGHTLLQRAVHRLKYLIQPDAVLILGDCVNDPQASDARERLQTLKNILAELQCPVIALPGNHDPQPGVFYEVMDRPPETMDIGHVRFLTFLDPEEPGYCARRLPQDLERMRRARRGHGGPIVCLQHVPVFPPGQSDSPYGYTNVDEIMSVMEENRQVLSVSGHLHRGTELIHYQGNAYMAVKALCEEPFSFTVLTLTEDTVKSASHSLRLPQSLALVDRHVHTEFAYCGRNMNMAVSKEFAELLGLAGLVFTEHSGQLYFGRDPHWRDANTASYRGKEDRMEDYWQAAAPLLDDTIRAGLEVDSDFAGNRVLRREDEERAHLLVGAVHVLPESRKKHPDPTRLADEFLAVLRQFISSGIHVLAHPFRVFRRAGTEVPVFLYDEVIRLLRGAGVAAELNFHTNTPDPEFVRRCMAAGVRISLGSDAHEQYEVGEFAQHLQLLADCGADGDLRDVLWP